jgi:hypothetical protein
MFNHKKLLMLSLLFSVLVIGEKASCQDSSTAKKKRNYSLDLYVGGGIAYYAAPLNPPLDGVDNKKLVNPIGTFRLMWQPDHRLGLGIESGYVTWYSYEVNHDTIKAKIRLTSIPVLVMWSMALTDHFKIFAGFGIYAMTTNLEYLSKMHSKTNSLGWSLAGTYRQPINKDLALSYELKWSKAHETRDDLVSLQVNLAWRFLDW